MTQPLEYSAPVRPTRARFGVLAFLCTMALLLYVDRVCIGQAASAIRAEFGLNKEQFSWVFTVFSLAYAIFELPAGHWGDKYGSRGIITRVVIWWSIFTALTGAAVGFWSILVIRFLFGAGEAGAFPNAARIVTRWFPPGERGRARGAITFLSLIGATLAPMLSGYLIHLIGWRWTFAIFGSLGVVWVSFFYRWFRDEPTEHPSVNGGELLIIGESAETREADIHESIPWLTVLSSANVWLLGLIMTVSGTLFYVQFQWFPTYLREARGLDEIQSGWLTSLVMLGGAIGCLCGGWLCDLSVRYASSIRWARRLSGGGALLLAGVSVAAARYFESTLAVALCNSAALFFMQAGIPTWWTVVAEVSGRHGGAMWGLMNSMASLTMMAVNFAIGTFVEKRQHAGYSMLDSWSPMFNGIAIGFFLGAIAWLLVDATKSIVDRRKPIGFDVEVK